MNNHQEITYNDQQNARDVANAAQQVLKSLGSLEDALNAAVACSDNPSTAADMRNVFHSASSYGCMRLIHDTMDGMAGDA